MPRRIALRCVVFFSVFFSSSLSCSVLPVYSTVRSCSVLLSSSHALLSFSILSYPILSCPVPSYPILSYPIPQSYSFHTTARFTTLTFYFHTSVMFVRPKMKAKVHKASITSSFRCRRYLPYSSTSPVTTASIMANCVSSPRVNSMKKNNNDHRGEIGI